MGDPAAAVTASMKPSFFACYLLCSLNPRFKGRTYIGFTVNPKRRIRQHNGEITSGARKTQKRRPWEMILCVHGFPSHVHALQFEWAWQHPLKSIAVRDAASELKRRGARGQVLLLFTMLNLPEWNSMNLVVNFLSTKHQPLMKGCPSLPLHMHVKVGSLDDLPCYKFPHSELSCSADEGELEEDNDSDGDSTEESCLLQAIQQLSKATHCNALQGPEKDAVQRHDNPYQVLAEIDNRAISVGRATHDARKSNKLGVSRKGKPKEGDKEAQTIGCSKKSNSVVSPSKKRGRPKSNKRKSLSEEELRESLAVETLPLPPQEVDKLAMSPSRFDCREVRDGPNTSPCLASFPTWEAYVDAPYFASPLSWDKDEANIEPPYTSPSRTVTISSRRPLGTAPALEPSLRDLVSNKMPCHFDSKTEGSSEAPPFQADSKVVDSSVVWDLSPLWSHFGKEDSPEEATICRTPLCSESETRGLDNNLPTVENEGIVINAGVVCDGCPLWSPTGHKAKASLKELSPWEATPCSTPTPVLEETANDSGERLPAAAWNASQFTPLWSPSPLPARNSAGLPFKRIEEREVEMNCLFSLSPLSCCPLPKPTGAAVKPGLSQTSTVGGFNSMEIIDLTDSPAREPYSISRFTYV